MARYEYQVSNPNVTGVTVVSCVNQELGLIVRTPLADSKRSFPGIIGYAGARYSRSRAGLVEILTENEQARLLKDKDPEKRLANIVTGLKHQSPAGMAHTMVAMEGLSIMTAATIFRIIALGDGQESSTRFIDFKNQNNLPQLENLLGEGVEISDKLKQDYRQLQDRSLELYQKWFDILFEAYAKHFEIDLNDKKQKDALTARTYDSVRGFLLSGLRTSMILEASATTWQYIISELGADRLPGEKQIAESLKALLSPEGKVDGYVPEIAELLNHTEANLQTKKEQEKVKSLLINLPGFGELLKTKKRFAGLVDNQASLIDPSLPADNQIIAQEILTIYPSLEWKRIVEYVKTLDDKHKAELGRIMFSERNRFSMPAIAASGGAIGVDLNIDLGIERDAGRHRALDRVSPIHNTHVGLGEIQNSGFTQIGYLREIPEFANLSLQMESDMNIFYEMRDAFLGNLEKVAGKDETDRVGMYLLPLAHQVEMIMNGDARFWHYFQDMRDRPGVHIDLREITGDIINQVRNLSPFFEAWGSAEPVIVSSREQFIDRS